MTNYERYQRNVGLAITAGLRPWPGPRTLMSGAPQRYVTPRHRVTIGLLLVALSSVVIASALNSPATASVRPEVIAAPTTAIAAGNPQSPHVPLSFEPNVGQAPVGSDFVASGGGMSVAISADAAAVALYSSTSQAAGQTSVVRMRLLNAASVAPSAEKPLNAHVNYLIGNDRSKWHRNIAQYGQITYRNVYPGVNLVYGGGDQFEFTFGVAPGADPSAIILSFSGAERVYLDRGDLVVSTPAGDLREHAPVAYQDMASGRVRVSSSFDMLSSSTVGFTLGFYDRSLPVVIDPSVTFATYLGGSDQDAGKGVATDGAGNVYVAGETHSVDFPTTSGTFQTTHKSGPGFESFVSKFSPAGVLIYSTYIDGTAGGPDTRAGGIAVDASGDAVIAGVTVTTNYPTTPGAFETTPFNSGSWGTLTKLNPSGSGLVYSTYVGDSVWPFPFGDAPRIGVALDAGGAAYVVLTTAATDFPVSTGTLQTTAPGGDNVVVAKFSASGTLDDATYLGGNGDDEARSIAVDASGDAFVEGITTSTDFPATPGALQTTIHGSQNLFVAKLNPTASALVYASYLGGSGSEESENDDSGGIAIDTAGDAFVTAGTNSKDFPVTPGAFQATNKSLCSFNAIVSEFNPSGSALVYSTYVGGSGCDFGRAITLVNGLAIVTGDTSSSDFPMANPTQPKYGGGNDDAFITEIGPTGGIVSYSSFLGGGGKENAFSIAASGVGVVLTGYTQSVDFPTVNAEQQRFHGGPQDAFVASISLADLLSLTMTASPAIVTAGQDVTYSLAVDNPGTVGTATSVVVTDQLPAGLSFVSATPSQGNCTSSGGQVNCALGTLALGASASISIVAAATSASGVQTNTASVSAAQSDPFLADNQASVSIDANMTDLGITAAASPVTAATGQSETFSVNAVNNGPTADTGVVVQDTLPSGATFTSAATAQGSCTQSGGIVNCAIGSMAVGATVQVTLVVAVPTIAPPGVTSLTNTATVSGDLADIRPTNNVATTKTPLTGLGCGLTLLSSVTLTGDIGPCPGAGVIIDADNITFNLAGHKIVGHGTGDGTQAGVYLYGHDGVTITNGSISSFDAGVAVNVSANDTLTKLNVHDNIGPAFSAGILTPVRNVPTPVMSDGIVVFHSFGIHVLNNTVNHNGVHAGIDIAGVDSTSNVVKNNTVTNTVGSTTESGSSGGVGINVTALLERSDDRRGFPIEANNVLSNTVKGNQGAGIVSISNVNATIQSNDVEGNGIGTSGSPRDGIQVNFGASPHTADTVLSNTVKGNGDNGIAVYGGGNTIQGNAVSGNNVNNSGSFDLFDNNSACDHNTWKGNTGGGTTSPSCT